jgi:hypothetical protein
MADSLNISNITIKFMEVETESVRTKQWAESPKAKQLIKIERTHDEESSYRMTTKQARKFIEQFCCKQETYVPTHNRGPLYALQQFICGDMCDNERVVLLSRIYNDSEHHVSPMSPSPRFVSTTSP